MKRRQSKPHRGFFSGNRKLVRRISITFWIASVLMLAIVGVQSYTSAKAQRLADQSYGVWDTGVFQISTEQSQRILENPMIETAGVQSIAGQVVRHPKTEPDSVQTVDEESDASHIYESFGNIGYADDSFFDLACLRLKHGQLPAQPNEIAVEAEALDALGISYELDQTFPLVIQTDESQFEEQTFKLCGVLENYSRFWNGDGSTLRFFTANSTGGELFDCPIANNVFYKSKPGYLDVWKTLGIDQEHIYWNDNREMSSDPFSSENLLFTALMGAMIFLFVLFLVESTALWIYRHRHEILLMRVFGIRRSRLSLDLFALNAKAAWLPLIVFVSGCFVLKAPVWIYQLFAALCVVLIPVGIAVLALYVSSVSRYQSKTGSGHIQKRKRPKREPVTEKTVRYRLHRHLAPNSLMTIATVLAVQLIWIFGAYSLSNQLVYQNELNSFPDYSVQSILIPEKRYFLEETKSHPAISSLFQYQEPISQEMRDQIVKNGNLKDVTYFGWTMNNEVAWPEIRQSLIYSAKPAEFGMPDIPGALSLNPRGEWSFYPNTYYYSQPEMIESLKKQDFEGSVNWSSWMQGKEAIISLPPVEETQPGVLNAVNDSADKGKIETTIKPGTILEITQRNGKRTQIPVSGIIRLPKETAIPLQLPAYSVHMAGSVVNVVSANLKSKDNQLSVELELSKLGSAEGIEFRNYASDHMVRFQKIKLRILLIISLCVAALAVGIFILIINQTRLQEKQDTYVQRLALTGLTKRRIDSFVDSFSTRLYVFLFAVMSAVLLVAFLVLYFASTYALHARIYILLGSNLILAAVLSLFFWRSQQQNRN